jgi:hypothetical protein
MVSVGILLDVGHAVFAVVAQGRIAVVGQQRDQVIGTVPGATSQRAAPPVRALSRICCLADGSAAKAKTAVAALERSCCARARMRRISADSYSRRSSWETRARAARCEPAGPVQGG